MQNTVFKFKRNSKYYHNPTGISQGGSIGPLLYAAFQNDISEIIKLPFLLYCDDLSIYLAGTDLNLIIQSITVQANVIQQWYDNNNMKLNYDKTKYQIFYKSVCKIPTNFINTPIILGNNQQIEQVQLYKYLGIYFDNSLTFKDHFNHVMKRVSSSLGYLYGIKRQLTEKVMIIMINCHVHCIIDYCVSIWAVQSDALLSSIQSKVDSFLRNYFLPSIAKKIRKKKKVFKVFKSRIDICELRRKCNMLTLIERRELFLYKYAFKNLSHLKSSSESRRTWPLLDLPVSRLKFTNGSINFRAIKLWNALPRNWDGNMSYNQYILMCRELILSKRKEEFLYY
jgi:hypothetical protein